MYTIDELFGEAWFSAIKKLYEAILDEYGVEPSTLHAIENIYRKLDVRFDENGNVIGK